MHTHNIMAFIHIMFIYSMFLVFICARNLKDKGLFAQLLGMTVKGIKLRAYHLLLISCRPLESGKTSYIKITLKYSSLFTWQTKYHQFAKSLISLNVQKSDFLLCLYAHIFMLYEGAFYHRMPIYMHMPMSLLDFPTNTKPFNSEFTTKGDIWA